jgi:hypothetical protein
MRLSFFRSRIVVLILSCNVISASLGCGGSGGGQLSLNPISVYLPVSTVTIVPGAALVSINIQINSPSETALVAVGGLPAGVAAKYAASDTNPSGILTLSANTSTMIGTYMPTITVMSSGQTVSTVFTLIVKSS